MGRPLVIVLLAAMLAATAGCADPADPTGAGTSSTSSSATTAPAPGGGDCDVDAPLPLLPTWAGHEGEWSGFVQVDAVRPQGIRGAGDAGDPGLSLLVDHGMEPTSSLDVAVDLALVSGVHPDGAGLAFHWTGPSYNIVRYSPSEGGWHLFTVIEGNRTKVEPRPLDVLHWVDPCEWVTLRIVADGRDVRAYQGQSLVLEATLPAAASSSGQAGLFLRGDTVALFDGYIVRAV
jgi:hypothetical protein